MVETGGSALEILRQQAFDLILMDVQMPGMDGLEATMAIRRDEKVSRNHIPIIALTAHAMAGYVTKPIRAQDLNNEISRLRGGMNSDNSLCGSRPLVMTTP